LAALYDDTDYRKGFFYNPFSNRIEKYKLAKASVATDSKNNWSALVTQYESGDRTPGFLKKYVWQGIVKGQCF
jgi:hypothetical protein